MLNQEQAQEIKKQLFKKIAELYPGEKEQIIQEIDSLSPEELELFLKKNNIQLAHAENNHESPSNQNKKEISCIFCAIAQEDISSYKIDENKDSIAVLEINPVSKAHAIIIPKKHSKDTEKLPQNAFSLAKKIAKKIKTKFKPKDIEIIPSNSLGHAVINVLPVFGDENIASPRKKAKEEELKEIQGKLKKEQILKKPKVKKIKEDKTYKSSWLPKRIP
ncbi:MAG: HIT domain-containing protein [Nanoarchaeota archaeon]